MLQQVNDGPPATAERRTVAARRLVRELGEISADLRECALLAPDGTLLAALRRRRMGVAVGGAVRGRLGRRPGAARRDPRRRRRTGEVFAVRAASGHVAIAVAARFALESLMLCDLRAALRTLEGPA